MRIQLNHVRPTPLIPDGMDPQSNIWNSSYRFESGQKYLVKAPSGKGKSTFIHLLYGIRKDFEGQIQLQDQDSKTFDAKHWAKLRRQSLSIVFQDLRLFPQLSAWDNIQLNAQLHPHKSEAEIRDMAALLGVDSLLAQQASTLSYGQQQRIALIRSLCQPF
ncbi:MAG: ATP-binding cassette domain-containing protein, partial [Bacteroidota bacterium]